MAKVNVWKVGKLYFVSTDRTCKIMAMCMGTGWGGRGEQ